MKSTWDTLLEDLEKLHKENATLRAENAELRAKIKFMEEKWINPYQKVHDIEEFYREDEQS
jgi:cell division protein FtsB